MCEPIERLHFAIFIRGIPADIPKVPVFFSEPDLKCIKRYESQDTPVPDGVLRALWYALSPTESAEETTQISAWRWTSTPTWGWRMQQQRWPEWKWSKKYGRRGRGAQGRQDQERWHRKCSEWSERKSSGSSPSGGGLFTWKKVANCGRVKEQIWDLLKSITLKISEYCVAWKNM